MRVRPAVRLAALLAVLALPLAAHAAPATSTTTAGTKYEDWTIGCEAAVEGSGQICFAYQKLTHPETHQVLANVSVGYPAPGKPPMLILNLPLGMLLPVGVVVQVDDTKPPVRETAPVKVCMREGCRAEMPFDQKLETAFRQRATARVAFMDTRERLIELPVSLQGFTKAFDSLKPARR